MLGRYVELIEVPSGLRIKLNDTGRTELLEQRNEESDGWKKGTLCTLQDLLEDWLGNGWSFVAPQDIGALTDAPILSPDVEQDDHGNVVKVGKVYWFPNYAVECELNTLLEKGEVFFPLAS